MALLHRFLLLYCCESYWAIWYGLWLLVENPHSLWTWLALILIHLLHLTKGVILLLASVLLAADNLEFGIWAQLTCWLILVILALLLSAAFQLVHSWVISFGACLASGLLAYLGYFGLALPVCFFAPYSIICKKGLFSVVVFCRKFKLFSQS